MDPSAHIVIRRPNAIWRDRLRSYAIKVDGVVVGKVRRGGQLELSVSAGPHMVRAEIDWTGSRDVRVDAGDGETIRLRVEAAGSALQLWQMIGSDRYLELVVE